MSGQIVVTMIDRDATRVKRFFDSVTDARAFANSEKELGARKIHLSVAA